MWKQFVYFAPRQYDHEFDLREIRKIMNDYALLGSCLAASCTISTATASSMAFPSTRNLCQRYWERIWNSYMVRRVAGKTPFNPRTASARSEARAWLFGPPVRQPVERDPAALEDVAHEAFADPVATPTHDDEPDIDSLPALASDGDLFADVESQHAP